MKRLIYSYLVLCLSIFAVSSFAQNYNMSKTYDKSFALTNDMEVSIVNKYGDIQIINWDIDSVRIQVKIDINSTKENKAQKLFEAININFKNNLFYTVAETELLGKNSLWTDITDKTKQIFNTKTTSRIDYIVHIPQNTPLVLKNKYGSIYMGDYAGELDIEVSNGDLKAHDILGKTKLNINFGDLYINKISHAVLRANSAEAEIEEIEYLETHTKSSKLYIEHIKELNLDSSHDKYQIGEISSIYGKGNFTYLKIKDLIDDADIDQKFGALHFRGIPNTVETFKLKTYKTDIHLSLNYENAYLLDFTTINPPQIQYPTGEYKKSEVVINEEDEKKNIQIIWGDEKSDSVIPIHIQAEEGNVFINVK